MGAKVYHAMAVAVLTLHLLWILWVICGALADPPAGARCAGYILSPWCTAS